MTAVIVIPIVMFLAIFGDNIMQQFSDNATDAGQKASDLKATAEGGASLN